MSFLRKLVLQLFSWKWSVFFILVFIFGWSRRKLLMDYSILLRSRLNQWDIVIGVLSDPFVLLYLFFPILLLLSCLNIKQLRNETHLIRVKTWSRWTVYSMIQFLPITVAAVFIMLVVSIVLSFGLPVEASWSEFSKAPTSTFNHMSALAQQSGLFPWAVIILQLVLIILFMLTIHVLTASIFLYFPSNLYLSVMIFLLLSYTLVTFRYFSFSPRFIIYNYMTIPTVLGIYYTLLPAFLILTSLTLLSISVIPLAKKWR